jgi:CIC family chloride channel protein
MSNFDLQELMERSYLRKWSLISILIGIIAGLSSIVFFEGLKFGAEYFLGAGAGFFPPESGESLANTTNWTSPARIWLIPIVLTIGGLVSGFLVYTFAPEAEGHGTDAAIRAFHKENGAIRKRTPIVKMLSSIVTISTGGSAGREGPIAHICAGFGSFVGSLFKLNARDRRLAVTIGVGAGVGSIFKAPLGGALLSTEILYMRDFEKEALIPSVIASIVGYSIFSYHEGFAPIFHATTYIWSIQQIPLFMALGLACAAVGRLYISAFYRTRNVFKELHVKNHFKPAIGAAIVGIVAVILIILVPEKNGAAGLGGLAMGYGFIQLAMYNELSIKIMFILIFAKIVMTSFTIGSGGSGGVFAPGLVIGAMVGGTAGAVFNMMFPAIVPVEAIPAFVIIGMMALFGGVAKAPIAVIVMVSEMTGDFTLLLPSMVAIVGSLILINRTIYQEQVPTRLDSPAHMGEYFMSLLEIPKVEDATRREFKTLDPASTIKESILLMRYGINNLPVVENDTLIGCLSMDDIAEVPFDKWEETRVRDIMCESPIVHRDETLLDAIQKMEKEGMHTFFVVDKKDPEKLVGVVTRQDMIRVYSKQVD